MLQASLYPALVWEINKVAIALVVKAAKDSMLQRNLRMELQSEMKSRRRTSAYAEACHSCLLSKPTTAAMPTPRKRMGS